MQYRFTATTKKGKVETGTIQALDSTDAAEQIRSAGLLLVSLQQRKGYNLSGLLGIGWVPNVTKVTFAKHLSLMIRAGLPLDESVAVLRDQSSGVFKRVLNDILKVVETGRPLSEAFAEHPRVFNEFFVSTIRAGETGGTLEQSLTDLAGQLTKSFDLRRKIKNAMTYPLIVVAAALILGLVLSLYVLPRTITLFESITVALPLSTRVLLSVSRFLVDKGIIFFPAVAGGIVLIWQLLKLKWVRPYSHALVLKLFFFGHFTKSYNLAVFARTMGTLLRSGINISEAVQITANTVKNERFKMALIKVKEGVEKGIPTSAALEDYQELFPAITTHMISVGEQTGRLEETYSYLAEFYEDEVDAMAKNLSTLLEPLLLIVVGLMVAGIAISIIAPIYNFIGNIDRL